MRNTLQREHHYINFLWFKIGIHIKRGRLYPQGGTPEIRMATYHLACLNISQRSKGPACKRNPKMSGIPTHTHTECYPGSDQIRTGFSSNLIWMKATNFT